MSRGDPEASGGKQFSPDQVYQENIHRGFLFDVCADVTVEIEIQLTLIKPIQDKQDFVLVIVRDFRCLHFWEELMNKSLKAVLLVFF